MADAYEGECHVTLDNGLRPDPYVNVNFHAVLVQKLNAVEGADVTIWFDNGCGQAATAVFTIVSLDTTKNRVVLSVNPDLFPDGVPCGDAVSICAHETEGCEDCASLPALEACIRDEDLQELP